MAFELLMGKAALTGNSLLAQIDRLRSGYVFSVPELERANPALLAVVQRMTEKDPARRFARATDVIAALDAIPMYGSGPLPSGTEDTLAPGLDSSRISARLAPPAAPPKRLATVLAIVGLLVVAAVALGLYAEGRDEPGTARPEQRAIVSIKKPETEVPAPLPAAPTPKPAPDPGQPEPKPAYTPIPSRGCERATPYEKVQLTGVNFYAPFAYKPTVPRPLVILLHDATRLENPGTRAREFFQSSGFLDQADQHNFVVIAPPDPSRGWQGEDDLVDVLRTTVETTAHELCIDEARVFIVSHGSGGRLASHASCAPWVTGVAVASFGFRIDPFGSWCPGPKPTIWLAPKRSTQVPRAGGLACDGYKYLPFDELEAKWRGRNDCDGTSTETSHGGGVCRSWTCETAFSSCELDGGYPWPGIEPTLGDVKCRDTSPPDFPMAKTVWAFFETVPSLGNTD